MQSFVCFIAFAVLAITTVSSASVGSSQQLAPQNILDSLNEDSNLNAPVELARLKKSAYGGASLPAPPCPKSYLFSCQPNVAQVPCAQAPAKSGYAGAYSAPVPTYSMPQAAYPGIPQELLRPIYNYNQYLY